MYINGSDPDNPIFLVDARGNYLMNPDGTYVLFTGEAHVEPGGTSLMSASGYYLVDTDGRYLTTPAPAAAASPVAPQAPEPPQTTVAPAPVADAQKAAPANAAGTDAPTQALPAQDAALGAASAASPANLPPSIPPAQQVPAGVAATAKPPEQPPTPARRELFPSADLRSADERQNDRRNTAIVVLALLLIAALAGLGLIAAKNAILAKDGTAADGQGEATAAVEQTEEAQPIQTAGQTPAGEEPSDAPSKAEPTQVPVPEGVYPGAGRTETPEGASPMATDGAIAYVTAPSGNITCAFGENISECRVASWADTQPYGRSGGENNDEWANSKVVFGADGSPSVGPVSDAIPKLGVLPYGSAATAGKWACGSAQNGLTCWNTETGHGAIINREGYQAF